MKSTIHFLLLISVVSCSPRVNGIDTLNAPSVQQSAVEKALDLIGSPYKYGGVSPSGFDCSGLIKFVYQDQGVRLNGGARHIIHEVNPISPSKLTAGDLVFFKVHRNINHVALVVEASRDKIIVIHSTSSKGVIKEDVWSHSYWKEKIHSYGRISI